MRQAFLIGRIGDKSELIAQPAHLTEQQELFKKMRGEAKSKYHEIQIVTQDGVGNRKHVFETDGQRQAHQARREADTKIFEAAKKQRALDAEKAAQPKHQVATPTPGLVKGATVKDAEGHKVEPAKTAGIHKTHKVETHKIESTKETKP